MDYNNRYLLEDADEEDIPFELEDETQFRLYIIFLLMLAKGFKTYAVELKLYYVNFTNNPNTTAAVDVDNKIIIINEEVANKIMTSFGAEKRAAEAELSMLIRHELLHAILKHKRRTIIYIAKKLGFDPFNMTQELYQTTMNVFAKPSILYRNYNGGKGIRRSNGAGDLDLSRYYIEKDIEINRNAGGLLLEDHPNWVNYSFEDILDALELQEKALLLRLRPIVYGEFDDDGNFVTDHEEESWFAKATSIDPSDIDECRLPTKEEAERFLKVLRVNTWTSTPVEGTKELVYYLDSSYGFEDRYITLGAYMLPILKVSNIDLYKQVISEFQRTKSKAIIFKCFDELIVILDTGEIIFGTPITIGKDRYFEFDDKSNDYKTSYIRKKLKTWFEDQCKNYSTT